MNLPELHVYYRGVRANSLIWRAFNKEGELEDERDLTDLKIAGIERDIGFGGDPPLCKVTILATLVEHQEPYKETA